MSQIAPAIMYMIFAICFLSFTLLMQLEDAAEIFESSVQRILDTPWQISPYKTIHDVKGGPEVYEWLKEVFLNQLYMEYPQPGDQQGYCTKANRCLLNEGDADNDDQCAGSLKKGVDNCPSYMGAGKDCCEPCTGNSCQNFTVLTEGGGTATTAVNDLSANCDDEMPSWLQELDMWNREDGAVNFVLQSPDPERVVFCPERMSKVDTSLQSRSALEPGRMLMVAQHNRVLMSRFTMKRVKIVDHTSPAFRNAYPRRVNSDFTDADRYNPRAEDEAAFGGDTTYEYQQSKGYKNAGGFVAYISFDKTKDQVMTQISKLKRNYWFDLHQGSFVVEMLLYNGNVERFLYVACVFEHDFSGQTQVYTVVNQLDLSLHDPSKPETYIRFLLYIVIIMLFCIFVKTEVDDMTADYRGYFSNFLVYAHVASLGLCAICIVQYLMIVCSYAYINFKFPMPDDPLDQQQDFEDLVNLASSMGTFTWIISWNLFLILARFITLMTSIIPQSGVIFNTFGQMKYNLVAFFMMFGVMMLGFSFAGYYLFGARIEAYSTLTTAILSSFRMMLREPVRAMVKKGDAELGSIFFVVFHLLFLIVQQILISVLIYGYDKERERIENMVDAERYPLQKHLRSLATWLRRKTNWLFRWFVSLQQFLFDVQGGPTARPNWERVARLRDRRATKPRIRNVDYGQMRDSDGGDDVKIYEDVTLRAVDPWYPNGMMHYYVDDVKEEGPAKEFKVSKNTFRLVAIQRQGGEDRKTFRSEANFRKIYKGDPQELLQKIQEERKDSSVTLEFEGGVAPLSWECCLLMFFISVFLLFALNVSRIPDAYNMYMVQENMVIRPQWYEYNPTRLMSLNKLDTMATLGRWVENAVLAREYECVTSIVDGKDCSVSDLTNQFREEWALWAGAGKALQPDRQPLEEEPKAADGLSIGFVPYAENGRSKSQITQTVRMTDYNIGVMPNNHVRITLQVACYRKNENKQWMQGYPIVLDPVLLASDCANEPCMKQMIEKDQCLNAQGEPLQIRETTGSWSGVQYTFSEEGTFGQLGGYSIGLGSTKAEGALALNLLVQDRLFRADSISFVFEFVTYNANYDMFTYTTVKFSQRGTGKFNQERDIRVFPLDIFSMGAREDKEAWAVFLQVCFAFYIIAAVLFMAFFFWDLSIQYWITVNLSRKWYMFIFDFFLEDWWNVLDLVSVVLNVMVIESIFQYMLLGGSLQIKGGVKSWTLGYSFDVTADESTVDPFERFHQVARLHKDFTDLVAYNGLFLLFRFVKYFSGLSALRLVMSAISSAINELSVILLMFIIMMVSFSLMFYIKFWYQGLSDPETSFINLFLYLNGRFDVDTMIANNPLDFAGVFIMYQVIFMLILNMFLAAIVYRWKDTRKDAQEVTLAGAWQKLKEPFSFSVLSFDKGEKQETQLIKLDADYWQKLSVLRHIAYLNENGQITVGRSEKEGSHRHRDAGESGGAASRREGDGDGTESEAESEQDAMGSGFNLDKDEDHNKFLKAFKKAHMEIASQMCRTIVVKRRDDGAGVGALQDEEEDEQSEEMEAEPKFEDDFGHEMIGIIEDPQPQEKAGEIATRMNEKLQEAEHPAEEIWLDALVTVLEEAGSLEHLQRFFRPLPMITPTKPQEKLHFKEKKAKMECRLNMFLRWLQEEARIKHYEYLQRMAQAKEKNLKQQSLVLTDYLETLDEQIVNLEKEIKVLERKNAHMRSHVSPLL